MSAFDRWRERRARRRRTRTHRQDLAVLWALLELGETRTFEISGLTGMYIASLHPVLYRLEQAGVAASRWEPADPPVDGTPRRRLYRPTGSASRQAAVLAQALRREWVP